MTDPVKSVSRPSVPPTVKSVSRTLETLEFFDDIRQPANVVAVARALGYPQSSTAALLKTMVAFGYLAYDPKKRTYYPTSRVALVGSWLNPPLFEEGTLIKLMKAVAARTGQLVLLGARNGDEAQYFHVLKPPQSTLHHIAVGTRRPLATSGVGRILLSTLPPADVRRFIHRINAYRSPGTEPVDATELVRSLAHVARDGYHVSFDRVVPGSGLVAMLLPTVCTGQPLALGLGAHSDVLADRLEEFVAIMREEMLTHFGRYLAAPDRPDANVHDFVGRPRLASAAPARRPMPEGCWDDKRSA